MLAVSSPQKKVQIGLNVNNNQQRRQRINGCCCSCCGGTNIFSTVDGEVITRQFMGHFLNIDKIRLGTQSAPINVQLYVLNTRIIGWCIVLDFKCRLKVLHCTGLLRRRLNSCEKKPGRTRGGGREIIGDQIVNLAILCRLGAEFDFALSLLLLLWPIKHSYCLVMVLLWKCINSPAAQGHTNIDQFYGGQLKCISHHKHCNCQGGQSQQKSQINSLFHLLKGCFRV